MSRETEFQPDKLSLAARLGLPTLTKEQFLGWLVHVGFIQTATPEIASEQNEKVLKQLEEIFGQGDSVISFVYPHEGLLEHRTITAMTLALQELMHNQQVSKIAVVATSKFKHGEMGFAGKATGWWLAWSKLAKGNPISLIYVTQGYRKAGDNLDVNSQAKTKIRNLLQTPASLLLVYPEATRVRPSLKMLKGLNGVARPHPHTFNAALELLANEEKDVYLLPTFLGSHQSRIASDYRPAHNEIIYGLPIKTSVAKKLFDILSIQFAPEVVHYHLDRNPTKKKNPVFKQLGPDEAKKRNVPKYLEQPDNFNFADFMMWLGNVQTTPQGKRGLYDAKTIWIDNIQDKISQIESQPNLDDELKMIIVDQLKYQEEYQKKMIQLLMQREKKLHRLKMLAVAGSLVGVTAGLAYLLTRTKKR